MTDWFDEFEKEDRARREAGEGAEEEADHDTDEAGATERSQDAADAPLSLAQIEELAARGGPWAELWNALAEAKADRIAKADRDRLAAEAMTALESESTDFSDPNVQAAIRVLESNRAHESLEFAKKQLQIDWAKQGYAPDSIDELAKGFAEDVEKSAWFFEGDPLYDNAEYRRFEQNRAFEARQARTLTDMGVEGRSIFDDLAEAEAGIAATLAERAS